MPVADDVGIGRGQGVVVATGMQTQIGLIAEMIQSFEEEPTPLQHKLDQLGKMLSIGALIICGLVFAVAALRAMSGDLSFETETGGAAANPFIEAFLIAVSLAIAAVPEGLPAVVTISLALGMREMIKRHALIRKLSAVETLGSATAICSDKTGTLTQNEMTVTKLWVHHTEFDVTGQGYQPDGVFNRNGKSVDIDDDREAGPLLLIGALVNDAVLEQVRKQLAKIVTDVRVDDIST